VTAKILTREQCPLLPMIGQCIYIAKVWLSLEKTGRKCPCSWAGLTWTEKGLLK